jgi:hypothetical protein
MKILLRLAGLWVAIGVVSAVIAMVLEIILPVNMLVITLLSLVGGAGAVLWSVLTGMGRDDGSDVPWVERPDSQQ